MTIRSEKMGCGHLPRPFFVPFSPFAEFIADFKGGVHVNCMGSEGGGRLALPPPGGRQMRSRKKKVGRAVFDSEVHRRAPAGAGVTDRLPAIARRAAKRRCERREQVRPVVKKCTPSDIDVRDAGFWSVPRRNEASTDMPRMHWRGRPGADEPAASAGVLSVARSNP